MHKVLTLASAVVFAFGAATYVPASYAEAQPHASSLNVSRTTLKNGLRVVIIEDKLAPVVTTQMNYLAGANEVPKGFPGTAHAVEHMMFRGSPGLSKEQLTAIGANLGGDFNAETRNELTRYYFSVPKQDLDVALRIHAIRMRGVDMKAADWKDERGAIEQEVSRDLSSPMFKAFTKARSVLFANTPYEHDALGTRESFDKTTAADLKKFHDTWYVPNNALLVIAGDVDPAATLNEVKQLFGDIPAKTLPDRRQFHLEDIHAQEVKLDTDTPYGFELRAFRMPGQRSKDYATAIVLDGVLGSKRSALYEMGLKGQALAGGFSTDFMPNGGIAYAYGVFNRGGDSQKLGKTVDDILANVVKNGVDSELVAAAKRQAIASLAFEKNSVTGLASAWSDALIEEQLSTPDDIASAIENVTPAQVTALAQKVFDPKHAVSMTLTPQSSGKPVASQGFGGAEHFGGKSTDESIKLPAWAAKAFSKLTVPASNLHPTDFMLDNGLRVIVQPESVSNTVYVTGAIKNNSDMQEATDKRGVSQVLESMFKFGTKTMNPAVYQQALDNIAADIDTGYQFSLSVPADKLMQGMQLLADGELSPALSEQSFKISQQQVAGFTAGSLKSPRTINHLNLLKALYPVNDPELGYATPESIMGLSLNDVQHFYQQTFRPDMTTIVIVGNVTPKAAKQAVERYFGHWQAKGPKPIVDYPEVPANKPSEFNTPNSSSLQDSVTMAQTVPVTNHDEARFALQLGNTILGGGTLSSRLYKDLREKNGLVYTVASGFDLGKTRSSFMVMLGCDPDKVAASQSLVIKNVELMQQELVSIETLNQAKGELLRRIPLGEASFDSIAGQLLSLSLADKPLDGVAVGAKAIYQLSAKDIQQAFKQYVRPDSFVTAVQGPAPKA